MNRQLHIKSLISNIDVISIHGTLPEYIAGISQHSRRCETKFIYGVRQGLKTSGDKYISDAIKAGAVAILTDHDLDLSLSDFTVPVCIIKVANFNAAFHSLSLAVYDYPDKKLKLIGITGTNGKSSSTVILKSILESANERCALIGTIYYDTYDQKISAQLTTPDIDYMCALLSQAVDAGCTSAVIEASSHALFQGRLDGLTFSAAGFTNLSQDHLDFHRNMDEYAKSKSILFTKVKDDGVCGINLNDSYSSLMIDASKRNARQSPQVITFGYNNPQADLMVSDLSLNLKGSRFRFHWRGKSYLESYSPTMFDAHTPLIGKYQGENLALSAGIALGLNYSVNDIIIGASSVPVVPGRMEIVNQSQEFSILVDYSHTPDALEKALKTLRPLCHGNLIIVFGCGGDRDRSKRPLMGQIAHSLADKMVITSDNPRTESPDEIIAEILSGISVDSDNVIAEPNRKSAIFKAISIAEPEDVVIIAGKGHENYQEINGVRYPFDDRIIAQEALSDLKIKGIDLSSKSHRKD